MLDIVSKSISSRKIKYEILDKILKTTELGMKDNGIDQINMYIDVESLIKQLYNGGISNSIMDEFNHISSKDKLYLSSEIINYASHYRHYFASRCNKPTRIFFYYSKEKNKDALSLFPDYRRHFYETRLDLNNPAFGLASKNIYYNLGIAATVCRYIPEIYVIETGEIESTILPAYIISQDTDENSINIINSNNNIYFQDTVLKNNTFVLEMKSDDSKIYDERTVLKKWIDKSKSSIDSSFHPSILSLAIPLVANKDLGFKSVKRLGPATSLKLLKKALDAGDIEENKFYINPKEAAESLSNYISSDQDEQFYTKFCLLNHGYLINHYDKELDSILKTQLVDFSDADSLVKVNEEYYSEYPLLFDFLFQGYHYDNFGYK